MFELFSRLLQMRHMELGEGKMILLGQPIGIICTRTLRKLEEEMHENGMQNKVYEIARDAGTESYKKMVGEYGLKDVKGLVDWSKNLVSLAGWGRLQVKELNVQDQEAVLALYESTYAREVGKSKFPVDNLVRGYLVGHYTNIFGSKVEGVEVKCLALGDKHCEFSIGSKKFLKAKHPALYKSQVWGKRDSPIN